MNFNKWQLLLLIILVGGTFIVVSNGSINTPYLKQDEKDEIPLADDPTNSPWFTFDFQLPLIEIPFIGGLLGLGAAGLSIIFLVFLVTVLLLVTSLIISRHRKEVKQKKESQEVVTDSKQKELEIRRQTLGKRIEEIISFLMTCLDGRYSQGITEGFERLDLAMKEYSKISRPGWLTPKEFTRLRIPYFNHDALIAAVDQFYIITYGQKPATQKELETFIVCFQEMIADQKVLSWRADLPPAIEERKE